MDVAITISDDTSDSAVRVEISDDSAYTPELCSDLLRRAADTALRLHGDMHTADDGE